MPASSDSALLLAGQLRSSSDDTLRELLDARGVKPAGIRDFFDLADALLDAGSVEAALSRLDRPTLATLAVLAELGSATPEEIARRLVELGGPGDRVPAALEILVARGLAARSEDVATSLTPVNEYLDSWPARGLPGLRALAAAPRPATVIPVVGDEVSAVDALAAERAFETTSAIVELVISLQNEPAHELARGGIALPDSKRLATAGRVELTEVPRLIQIADRAGLIARHSGLWTPEDAATQWLAGGPGERWARLAAAWLAQVPADIRDALAALARAQWGERLDEYVSWLYPAGGDWMRERVEAFESDAALLGITARDLPSTPGAALLTDGMDAAATAMTSLYPPIVRQVYLQRDLTIVAPGPLEPAVERRLRLMADLDARALATTWRISAASLDRAMAAGEHSDAIRDFLTGISLTGIPQPLDYLLRETATRFGLVRVAASPSGGTRVHSVDASILRALAVDRSVASLGLAYDGGDLTSRFDRDVVFFSLADARYPVAAEDEHGAIVVPTRPRLRSRPPEHADTTGEFIARLRTTEVLPDDSGDAWIARQLDIAARGKFPLVVSVRMPNGTVADYLLEPASVAGGRLRARDRGADLERTLPLTSIVAVAPVAQ
ncbi:hypothetical protein HDC94_001063 [Leifsonia sp. AK011]|uniref:helicase-associated domain-containing protein n=1 Tax=Leifsonia sp. AK011 TaxID=2723075 RepID=UPI0015CBE7ED|nr:helicase-associated domain-containing protein [Leifsonia sp. AK011]NYF09907.1 hypothetical protein [Leifsonia sp. AK011]